jgi:hypothetical protein
LRLTLRILGLDVLDLDMSTDSPFPEPDDDPGWALSGGSLTTDRIEDGPTDRYMGFTMGMEDE